MTYKKKLIEVALPLEAINVASAREKGIRPGHPSALHQWWARRPLAAARAVIFAQMVDDPSGHPDIFKTEKAQEKERQRLFRIIEKLVKWESTTNETALQQAREEIWQSWRYTCAENADHPRAKELFDRFKLPSFHDPFAGGGALPLEAQRLGLESYATDLNPVAVLINKAAIEIPPKFAGRSPVNPVARNEKTLLEKEWSGAQGLVDDVRYYGKWMRDEAQKRIGHLYPGFEVTPELVAERPDLRKYQDRKLTVIAWIWARTVKSPNPAFTSVDVPLASTFMLSTKVGKEAYIEPVIEGNGYRFKVRMGNPLNIETIKNGTKLARGANFKCLMSGAPIAGDYIKAEGKAGRMGVRLMAIVAIGDRERVYLSPTDPAESLAHSAKPEWRPDVVISGGTRYVGVKPYGMEQFSQIFTSRQLVALTTLSSLVDEARGRVEIDAKAAGLPDSSGLEHADTGAEAYANAVGTYLAFGVSKAANRANTLATWMIHEQCPGHLFRRHVIPMSWDFCEGNTVSGPSGSFWSLVDDTATALEFTSISGAKGFSHQVDAAQQTSSVGKVISTDPPYYDNVPYADLSDFFYVWLRRTLKPVFPDLFVTIATPKTEELVAFPDRHKDKAGAEAFFLSGMTQAMHRLVEQAHPAFPVTIYYAFKQSEDDGVKGTASTGWETFLDAVIQAGFTITGTWPIRTERMNRSRNQDSNALASSIVLVCRQHLPNTPTATRREFVAALKAELPQALAHLQAGNIAPVDLAQAAIGPGMAVYTRYAKVLDAEGKPISVRAALALINQTLDEALAEQESDFDADTRWALTWFDQTGFAEGDFGVAEQLSKSKNTAVAAMVEAGILVSKGGKVRLLKPAELPAEWDPSTDKRLTVWEMVHQLIRVLEASGEGAAATLVAKLGSQAETARELCYRLYTLCERKKRANEAMAYNGLVQSWPEITGLARGVLSAAASAETSDLFEQE
jgi:putative DNA methylase